MRMGTFILSATDHPAITREISRSEAHAGMMAARRPNREVGVPELLRSGPYRFLFHSREHDPPHVHVRTAESHAVFLLETVRLRKAEGYSRHELARIEAIVRNHRLEFVRRWHEHFAQ